MKFKFLGLYWDLTPLFTFFGILWVFFCMFGGMAISKGTPAWYVAFYFISVFITLSLTPTFAKWSKRGKSE